MLKALDARMHKRVRLLRRSKPLCMPREVSAGAKHCLVGVNGMVWRVQMRCKGQTDRENDRTCNEAVPRPGL